MAAPGELATEIQDIEAAGSALPYARTLHAVQGLGFSAVCDKPDEAFAALTGQMAETGQATEEIKATQEQLDAQVVNQLAALLLFGSESPDIQNALLQDESALEELKRAETYLYDRADKMRAAMEGIRGLIEFLSAENDVEKQHAENAVDESKQLIASSNEKLEYYRASL